MNGSASGVRSLQDEVASIDGRKSELASLRTAILRDGVHFCDGMGPSGGLLNWVTDLREVLYRPQHLKLAADLLWARLRQFDPQCIGGMTMSAEQLVCGILQAAWAEGRELSGFAVRRTPKSYGRRRQIEGVRPWPGARTVIVDDLINSGGTMARVADILRPFDPHIVAVAAVLDFDNPSVVKALSGMAIETLLSLHDLGITTAQAPTRQPDWTYRPVNIGSYTAPQSTPLLDGDGIVVGSDQGLVLAFDREGQEQWRLCCRDRQNGVRSVIAAYQDSIVYGAYDGFVYRVSRRTGIVQWEKQLGHWIGASPTIDADAGVAYLAANYNEGCSAFVALSLHDGQVIWRHAINEYSHARPAIASREAIVFATNGGSIQARSPETGQIIWQAMVPGAVKGWIASNPTQCFLGCFDGQIYAFDIASGDVRWRRRLADWLLVQPVVHENHVILGGVSHVCALAASDGSIAWLSPMNGRVTGIGVDYSSGIGVAASTDGLVCCLDLRTGTRRWQFQADGAFRVTAGMSEERCAVPGYDRALYTFLLA
jgi:orotate phosphoribosyltransferase